VFSFFGSKESASRSEVVSRLRHRYLCRVRSIELVLPKKVGNIRAACFHAGACGTLVPGKSPSLGNASQVWVSSVPRLPAGRPKNHLVPSFLKSMPCERRPEEAAGNLLNFTRLCIDHNSLFLRTINFCRTGISPHGAIDRTHRPLHAGVGSLFPLGIPCRDPAIQHSEKPALIPSPLFGINFG